MENSNSSKISENRATILLVDDNPANLGVLEGYLKDEGYRLLFARSGELALKRVEHTLPDLILLDVMMPGTNGFEVCEILKRSERFCEIPVIFMTALANEADKLKGFELGAVDYISKPVFKGDC